MNIKVTTSESYESATVALAEDDSLGSFDVFFFQKPRVPVKIVEGITWNVWRWLALGIKGPHVHNLAGIRRDSTMHSHINYPLSFTRSSIGP
jgi:hypothetical protein